MPKIIFTSRFIKGGGHGKNLVNYMATRDGVELPQVINGERPATANQRKLIDNVLRELPQTAELFEYEDYAQSPNVANASAFISTVFEQNPELWSSVRNYVEYIARRPGAERSSVAGHGLWNGDDAPIALARVADEVANHGGNIWTHVVSLRREDAERMGYTSVEPWRDLVIGQLKTIANAMQIPMDKLRWYAAYHDKDTNPHIHLLVYSADKSRGYLTEPSIERMRSSFARSIFADEFMHIYERKDIARSELNAFADERLRELAASLDSGNDTEISAMLTELGAELQHSKGRKQYGYLKPALKQKVDEILRRLAADPRVAEMYAHWCELTADVKRIYTGKPDTPLPLEHEKTFKTIRNMVVKYAIDTAARPQVVEPQEIADADMLPEIEIEEINEPIEAALADEPSDAFADDDAPLNSGNMWSAEYKAARQYLYGQGMEKDFAKAVKLLTSEAELGNVYAAYELAGMHEKGIATELDADTAQRYYEVAFGGFLAMEAKGADDKLQYRLGKMLLDGKGAERDVQLAADYFRKAAENRNAFAQYSLAKLILSGAVEDDHEDAIEWLTASAEQGNQFAQYTLGKHYLSDEHRNTDLSVRWLTTSAKQGNEYAQYALGKHYLTDEHRDTELAVRWLTASAELGNQFAQYQLGKMHLKGDGVAQDRELAREFFTAAAEQGNEYAQWFIDHMDDAPAPGVGELLRHLARMVRQDYAQQRAAYEYAVDRKLMAKIRRKKQELGQKFE